MIDDGVNTVTLDRLVEQVMPHMGRGANAAMVKDWTLRGYIQFCQDSDFLVARRIAYAQRPSQIYHFNRAPTSTDKKGYYKRDRWFDTREGVEDKPYYFEGVRSNGDAVWTKTPLFFHDSFGAFFYVLHHPDMSFGNLINLWQGDTRDENILPLNYISKIETDTSALQTFVETGLEEPATDPIIFEFSCTPLLSATTLPKPLFDKYQTALIAKACMLAGAYARKHDWAQEYQTQLVRAKGEQEAFATSKKVGMFFGEPNLYGTEAERLWDEL